MSGEPAPGAAAPDAPAVAPSRSVQARPAGGMLGRRALGGMAAHRPRERQSAASAERALGACDPDRARMLRGLRAGLLAAAALVLLQAAAQALDYGALDLRIRALNSDSHASVFGIASLLAQGVVAVAGARRAYRRERGTAGWLALAALLGALVFVRALVTYRAAVVAVPLACVLVLICALTWRDPRAARAVVWAALALMGVSLALHEVGLAADASTASDYSWAYQITAIVKHGCELAGWVLAATGIAAGGVGRLRAEQAEAAAGRTRGGPRPERAAP